jgi:hypothetical protein
MLSTLKVKRSQKRTQTQNNRTQVKLPSNNKNFFGISEQFAIRKSTIAIYRATSIFDLHMRIFNLQGIRAPDKP